MFPTSSLLFVYVCIKVFRPLSTLSFGLTDILSSLSFPSLSFLACFFLWRGPPIDSRP